MTLRNRFVLACSAITLLTLSSAFGAVWLGFSTSQLRQRDLALVTEATDDAIRASYATDWVTSGRFAAPAGELGPVTRYATIYDSSARPVAWTRNLEPARPALSVIGHAPGVAFDVWWNGEHLRAVLVSVHQSAGQLLWLATPRTDLDANAAFLVRAMAVAVSIAVIAAAAAAAWLARVLTRDHERMASVARAVAAGDLSARVGPVSSDRDTVQLGRDLDEMISRLAALVETQRRFIANASHELRSPLTTLLGELSFALQRERDAATYRAAIEEALESTRRLKALTEDLLALARIGGSDFEVETVSLSQVTKAAFEWSRTAAQKGGVTMETWSDGAVVQGHPRDLERLMRNLIENAVRHCPPGGRVLVETHGDADGARVIVSDEGPGVPPDARERIFEPFFRLDRGRADHSGAGLGLAIGRTIARAHGGDLWVDSAPSLGGGARFVLSLPVSGPPRRKVPPSSGALAEGEGSSHP
ncbi:MAG TPA: HAMP domain-containing sensor histidine kinase [Polyangiaceae bacterium]|nr:HAMP domain-containing sensor histidine kinase [Polyangiaceae bacterium]